MIKKGGKKMDITTKTSSVLEEEIHVLSLPRGGKCYIIPKYGFKKSYAVISFGYGSATTKFILDKVEKTLPDGNAHFIEHKMFDNKDGNAINEFLNAGANINAFTDFNKTSYYFSSDDNFYSNLKRLVKMVTIPCFNEEAVEKEKSIITSEINMYNDNPAWRVYYNMLSKMYFSHSVKVGVAGTIDSVNSISVSDLTKGYDAFYTLDNMKIVVCGDVKAEAVADTIIKNIDKSFFKRTKCKSVFNKERTDIKGNYIKDDMNLKTPVFNLGFKFDPSINCLQTVYAMKMLLDILLGESSYFFEMAQKTSILKENLSTQFLWSKEVSFIVVMGKSDVPKDVANSIIQEVYHAKNNGINETDFNRIKKKHIGRFIRGFNSVQAITMSQNELSAMNADLIDAFDVIKNININCLEKLLKEFDKNKAVLSIV